MSVQQQQFIQILIETGDKLSLVDFFKNVHQKFYSDYDISFMEYFLELTEAQGEFVVHHEKLIEYGIVTSNRSSDIKEKLDNLRLVENEDYNLRDVPQVRKNRGDVIKKVYMITPEAFKKCLMRAQRRPRQKVDPVIYCDYYLLLEKTYKLYTDYEKRLLSIQLEHQAQELEQKDVQLEQKDVQLEQKDVQLEQKSQQLESQKHLVLRLNEMLIDSTKLPKTQVVYIATSSLYASQNTFKVGGGSAFGAGHFVATKSR